MFCTLKDIAKELNVTVNTVSRALKDKDDISSTLKEKIKKTAKELGYVPNINARFLRTGKTQTVAIVYDHFLNPYYSIVTGSIQSALAAEGYNIMIFTDTNDKVVLRLKTVQKILSTGADGIISFLEVEEEAVNLIRNAEKNLLILGRNSRDKGIDCISTDDVEGGYLATKHLIENGHKDILMFSAAQHISCVQDRLNGYIKAHEEFSLKYKLENVMYLNEKSICDGKAMVKIAEEKKLKYTAIFCFNDILAFEAITELRNYGKQVPEDVSIVGYDHIESHFFLPVGLTTIDADKTQVAEVAAQVMIYKLNNKDAHSFYKIHAPELIEGSTVRNIT